MKSASQLILEAMDAAYRKWRRGHVTYRGSNKDTPMGTKGEGRSGVLGNGLYSTPISNKEMTKNYGKNRYILVNAVPQKPLIVQSINAWELWLQNLIIKVMKLKDGEHPDKRDFFKKHTIEGEVQKLGYDGVIIKGREMVIYDDNKVRWFESEHQVEKYYEDFVAPKS